jgi:DNA-binding transcriptional LysR family regulator
MLLSHLKTLIAIQTHGSFAAAAAAVNLSHSAVSIQMRRLEQTSGLEIFQKGKRPAMLTPLGRQFVLKAAEVLARAEELQHLGRADSITGSVSIGFVTTTLQTLLPITLAELRRRCPDLRVSVRSGLSDELALHVSEKSLDFAFLTAPTAGRPDLRLDILAEEPLALITDTKSPLPRQPLDVFLTRPMIALNKRSWLGNQIAIYLQQAGIPVDAGIELDSMDAVENLVALGHGVSVVPVRALAPKNPGLSYMLLPGDPAPSRQLVLASYRHGARSTIRTIISEFIQTRVGANAAPLNG